MLGQWVKFSARTMGPLPASACFPYFADPRAKLSFEHGILIRLQRRISATNPVRESHLHTGSPSSSRLRRSSGQHRGLHEWPSEYTADATFRGRRVTCGLLAGRLTPLAILIALRLYDVRRHACLAGTSMVWQVTQARPSWTKRKNSLGVKNLE